MVNVILHANISHESPLLYSNNNDRIKIIRGGDTLSTRGWPFYTPPRLVHFNPPDTFCMHKTIGGDIFRRVILFRVTGTNFVVVAQTIFFVTPSTFLALLVQIFVFVSAFVMVSTV